MLTMRDHDVQDYVALRDMDATDVGTLREDDRACLDELGEYLVSTDAYQRFAIWLLHKHFEPDAEEVFVESVVTAPRGTETTPVKRCKAAGLAATAIRFDPGVGSGVGVVGMEFADEADFGSASPLGPGDEAALAGIAERLRDAGKIDRFGVRLIRNPLGLSDDEVLVETCDLELRSLYCSVGERDNVGPSIETSWQWEPSLSATGPTARHRCMSTCTQDSNNNHYLGGHIYTG